MIAAVVAVSAEAAAGAAIGAAAAASQTNSPHKESVSTLSLASEKVSTLKEELLEAAASSNTSLSSEERGRILGSLLGHEGVKVAFSDRALSFSDHLAVDEQFHTNLSHLYTSPYGSLDPKPLFYEAQGEVSLALGYPREALEFFQKGIEIAPTSPHLYLDASRTLFQMGEYDQALSHFEQFSEKAKSSKSSFEVSTEFIQAFGEGLSEGVYESGKGLLLFVSDLFLHPIHTGGQVAESMKILARLVVDQEFEQAMQQIAPEVCELVKHRDTIPSDQRGRLTGRAFGKYGADFLIPMGASKGLKGAKEVSLVTKQLQKAD